MTNSQSFPLRRIIIGFIEAFLEILVISSLFVFICLNSHFHSLDKKLVGVKIQLEGKKLEFQRKKHHGGSILTHYAPSPLPSTDHQLVKLDSMLCHIIKLGPASVIKANTCGIMVIHTARIRIRIITLLQKQDRRTGLCLEEYPRSITTGEAALALIRPDYLAWPEKLKYDCQFLRRKRRPSVLLNDGYCVDTFSHFPMMGRFVIYLQRGDSLVGVVKEINPKRE